MHNEGAGVLTRLFYVDPAQADPETVGAVGRVLLAGGVCVLPTDTVYGLHCLGAERQAVAAIAELKQRPGEKSFVHLIPNRAYLQTHWPNLAPESRDMLACLWPGPLTAILPAPLGWGGGTAGGTVALRLPDQAFLRSLLEFCGAPLVSTSANRSGEPVCADPVSLFRAFDGRVEALVYGGRPAAISSTIVDLCGPVPRLVREGALPSERLAPYLGGA